MHRSVVLIVSADAPRRAQWSAFVRDVGHWPLAAATLDQALAYMHKVRPGLVLTEAQVGPDRSLWLLDDLRNIAPLEHVPVVVVGQLAQTEVLVDDPAVYGWLDPRDEAALRDLLEELLTLQPLRRYG